MSVRSAHPTDISDQIASSASMVDADATELGEGVTGFQASNRNNPLNRKVVVSVRATLADLSTNAGKAVWAPSAEALKGIYQCAPRFSRTMPHSNRMRRDGHHHTLCVSGRSNLLTWAARQGLTATSSPLCCIPSKRVLCSRPFRSVRLHTHSNTQSLMSTCLSSALCVNILLFGPQLLALALPASRRSFSAPLVRLSV